MSILGANAERLSLEIAVKRVENAKPYIIVMVLYGQNPTSGTTRLIGRIEQPSANRQTTVSQNV